MTGRMDTHIHTPREIKICLLGYGNVGAALHRAIIRGANALSVASGGAPVRVVSALVRDDRQDRIAPEAIRFTSDFDAALDGCDVVCEALGGLEPARSLAVRALASGRHYVTANKQLVAAHGHELWDAAREGNSELRYEAAACGAIPIVRMIRESLAPSTIRTVAGIMNGTSNFILTSMSQDGAEFSDALAEAQRLGFAEPDPTDDVTGADAAAKLVLLASAAFHCSVALSGITTWGIDQVEAVDVRMAQALGYEIKPISRASVTSDAVMRATLVTGPMLVPRDHGLAAIHGATNAVLVGGEPFGELIVQGAGAGGDETASAMLGDLGTVLAGSTRLAYDPGDAEVVIVNSSEAPEPQYLRLRVPDRPGVLAEVAQNLADAQVSIAQVVQERDHEGQALLVLTTHPAPRKDVESALLKSPSTFPPFIAPMLTNDGATS